MFQARLVSYLVSEQAWMHRKCFSLSSIRNAFREKICRFSKKYDQSGLIGRREASLMLGIDCVFLLNTNHSGSYRVPNPDTQ